MPFAAAQLRVVEWNVTNYSGGRVPEFQTAIYGVVPSGLALAGRSMAPDAIVGQEFLSQAGVNAFVQLLNTAPGSPGDWAAAPFIDGPDTDNAFFYRTSKLVVSNTVIISAANGSTTLPPRHTVRYDARLAGFADIPGARISFYSTHMKSGTASTDLSRRLQEASKIRDNANGLNTNGSGTALPAGWNFLVAGDFNIRSANESAYQRMVQSEADDDGRFFDPINAPGTWYSNSAFRFIHTQDPSTTGSGGMDDRHDQILIGASLLNNTPGLAYVGNQALTFSSATWNDPNHSYRCWGNDGSTFNLSLATATNTMVGPAIAQALVTVTNAGSTSGGHLPVLLDLRVPAKITSDTILDFGRVRRGSAAIRMLNVSNSTPTGTWVNNGYSPSVAIETLTYTLSASFGFVAPAGSFNDVAGGGGNAHTITMNTSTIGNKVGVLTISSNSIETPGRIVQLVGEVFACAGDFNDDGLIDFFDYLDFANAFSAEDVAADFNGDGTIDFFDYLDFVQAFDEPCE
ncbi:MAG: hypothetical protein SFZ23_04285 [Planctomycetota bacterium]|nr:hypothetical protein [Planctomycetota bacterium]